jgi:hypothetical protein
MSRNRGRPVEVEGGERCSILFGRRELRILAKAEQRQLAFRNSSSRSAIVRQMVRWSSAKHGEELQDLWKKDLEVEELRRRLEQEEQARLRAEEDARAARNKARAKETTLQRLLQHLPMVRQKVAVGLETPTKIALLDQVWVNAGQSWKRVLERLEQAERDQGGGR